MQKIYDLPTKFRRIVALMAYALLTACGGGGGGGGDPAPLVNAIPTGYYNNTGTASVLAGAGNTQVTASDLEGMIYNNRLMMQSVAQGLSYDGTITISGNSYSGTLSVYDDGVLLGTAPVSGTITQGSTVTGTLSGTGAGNGTFTLNYAATNAQVAALGRVEETANPFWHGPIGGSTSDYFFGISASGALGHAGPATSNGTFHGCEFLGDKITPIAGTNLYSVTVMFDPIGCINPNIITVNNYTGLATTRQRVAADDTLVFMVTNGTYSLATDFIR